eukprot:TRINITY_DN16389_c0_g1_i1.p1 TRINITY_DN16389_c0_g1~~TRINITY_DN16389_c0_g1_i1.p1  ORF type:complete len:274 (-),score=80.30 TRINITY_DN16389_c0_g1_i1:443-1264(-)
MIRRPPRSTLSSSSAASDVYKRQEYGEPLLSMSKRTREDEKQEAIRHRQERVDPVSLEDLLDAKKEQQEQLSKPKFLTPEERAQIAIRRREAQMAAKREMQAEAAQRRAAQREHEQNQSRADRRGRDRTATDSSTDQKVLEAIRSQYLGTKPKKKKVLKPSEKFKFSFDWDMTEDTSRDLNPLYQDRPESALLFGRGRRAGIDVREQQTQNEFYESLVTERLEEQERIRKQEKKERKRQRQAEKEARAANQDLDKEPEEEEEDQEDEEDQEEE